MKDQNELGLGLAIPNHFVRGGAQHQVGAGVYRLFTVSVEPPVSSSFFTGCSGLDIPKDIGLVSIIPDLI